MAFSETKLFATIVRVVLLVAFLAAVFGSAGTLNWPRGWIYLALAFGEALFVGLYLRRKNPELARRRQTVGKGTKGWDRLWLALWWPMIVAMPLVAGLTTVRVGVPPTGWGWWALGLACFLAGIRLSVGAMLENPFFEGTVRIQTDRGQRVIDSGPYAVIRHPGYLGLALFAYATPLLLGSRQAEWVALVAIMWLVARTSFEDRTLRRELPGYEDYTRRVRWRLLPWVW